MKRARNQDFERYAIDKPFQPGANEVWIEVFDRIASTIGKSKSEISVLDFGCGDGKYFEPLKERGIVPDNISGTEVSELRISRCKAMGWHNATYLSLNSPLPFADDSFDIVQMMEVIEHIPKSEIDFYLKEIRRVLKPGGFIIATTPNYPIKRAVDVYNAFKKKKWNRLIDDPTHVALYGVTSLENRLTPFFSNVTIECFKRGPLYKYWKRPQMLHKLIATGRKA